MGKGFFKLPHFLKKLLSHPSNYFVPVFSPPPKYAADQTRPQVFNPGGGTRRNVRTMALLVEIMHHLKLRV